LYYGIILSMMLYYYWQAYTLCAGVIDSGISISPHLQQVIFEVFSQTDEGAQHGGTSLGLTIAHEQVKLMGSQLQLGACPRIERELRGSWFESVFALLLGE
jgi:signal transduction histidine kinase